MGNLGNNLRHLRKERGITQEQLANKLGINRSMIGAYEESRAEPKMNTLLNLCHYFNTDLNNLILKDISGEENKKPKVDIPGKQLRILSILVDRERNDELISVVPIKASAGYMNGYGDVDFIESLQKFRLPVPEISPNKTYRVFQIAGDSMLPIEPGSYIICEYVHDWHEIRNEHCYILVTLEEGIVYKRLINNLREGHLMLKPDNPQYKPYKISPDAISEIWRALGYISFNLPETNENQLGFSNIESMISDLKKDVNSIKKNLYNAG